MVVCLRETWYAVGTTLLLGIIKFQCGFHYLFLKMEAFFNSIIILSSHFLNSFCPLLLFLLHLLIKQLPLLLVEQATYLPHLPIQNQKHFLLFFLIIIYVQINNVFLLLFLKIFKKLKALVIDMAWIFICNFDDPFSKTCSKKHKVLIFIWFIFLRLISIIVFKSKRKK